MDQMTTLLITSVSTVVIALGTAVLTNLFQRRKLKAEAEELRASGTQAVFTTALQVSELVRQAEERSRTQMDLLRDRLYTLETQLRATNQSVVAHGLWDASVLPLARQVDDQFPEPPKIILPGDAS